MRGGAQHKAEHRSVGHGEEKNEQMTLLSELLKKKIVGFVAASTT
jgi:hypothetical protein